MADFKHILCAVDFSPTSRHALEYAVALAGRLGAAVEVLHIHQAPAYAMPDGAFELPPDLLADLTEQLQSHLDEFVKSVPQTGVTISASLREGAPYEEIVRTAKERAADMIVIGTHGRTGFSHLLMGSVAERVVRSSEVPVVTVRTQ
jgi:nucleotide-binding universal stress UspA family protein